MTLTSTNLTTCHMRGYVEIWFQLQIFSFLEVPSLFSFPSTFCSIELLLYPSPYIPYENGRLQHERFFINIGRIQSAPWIVVSICVSQA
ncbi:hypothetical protein K450DRAFT_232718 [Umbelopsis ramanniana AG]|uniref:Uncharacterized protein n=1 Tax=Umbelopsis ramanniana AG TaxID=1314678 RepID=A0AAD5ECD3_UMBRA|nr:uncharacterized protein K450DRAFT_232718 [Umbelopsis ramanniana AG]KAI8581368.1 hypothetical protein K450DRAFT_232718 [Umbelopsis ramanniana AG]